MLFGRQRFRQQLIKPKHTKLPYFLAAAALSAWLSSPNAQAAEKNDAPATLTNWVDYGGNAQRTNARNESLGTVPNLIWRYTASDDPSAFYSSPLVTGTAAQRRIFFVGNNKIYALDGETGAAKWQTSEFDFSFVAPPIMLSGEKGDVLYCISSTGNLLAINPTNGKTLSSLSLGTSVQGVSPVPVSTSAGERLIIGSTSGKVIAVDIQKMEVDPAWDISLGRFGAGVTATPALTSDGKYLYIPAQDNNIYVIDVEQIKIYYRISVNSGIIGSPVIAGNSVLVASGSLIRALDDSNGKTKWTVNLGDQVSAAPAASVKDDGSGIIYAGTTSGTFYAINLSDGKRLWQSKLNDPVSSSPTALDDIVLIGTRSGMLMGLDPQNEGQIKWQYKLGTERMPPDNSRFGGRFSRFARNRRGGNTDEDLVRYGVSNAPSIAGKNVYVAADNMAVYAFGTQDFDIEPPLMLDLKTHINNTEGELQEASGRFISGRAPVVVRGKILDGGSGVDPDSIKITVNKEELSQKAYTYNAITGEIEIFLTGAEGEEAALPNGAVAVQIEATDYSGNKTPAQVGRIRLNVDNNTAAPEPTNSFSNLRNRWRGGRR